MLADHGDVTGKAWRRAYDALESEFGPFTPFQRMEAGRCAAAWIEYEATTLALSDARTKRRTGKGRRPNEVFIMRLAKRQGLSDRSYADAVQRLRDLTSKNRRPKSLADELKRQQSEPGP
jgi:hypothetical protein